MCKYTQSSVVSCCKLDSFCFLVTHLVHVTAFGFTVNCLETEIQNAKFYPKAQVLSEVDKSTSCVKCVCVGGGVTNKMVWSEGSYIFHSHDLTVADW